jgi:hypothetical protein
MRFKLFEDFVRKHQGKQVFPEAVYHKSNPKFRETIDKEGLKCMKGDSYATHSPEESETPAIFGYFGDIDSYDSTWDDDIWLIHTNDDIKWYVDLEMGDDTSVVTYEDIPRDHIKLEYKGTGKSK